MPKLDLTRAIRIKGAGGEIMALKGAGFSWVKPGVVTDPILAYFQATGADGAYYTPWDKSTLFQDVAGTIPVVNNGDPVALMLDVSGNNKHLSQSNSARRPQYKTDGVYHWLYFDGVDDHLENSSFIITGTVELTHFSCIIAEDRGATVIPYAFSGETIGSGIMPVMRTSGTYYTDRYGTINIDRSDASYFDKKLAVAGRYSATALGVRSIVNNSSITSSASTSLSNPNGFTLGTQSGSFTQLAFRGRFFGGGSVVGTYVNNDDMGSFRLQLDSKGYIV